MIKHINEKDFDIEVLNENPNVSQEYRVKNIPTIKIFKNGEELSTNVGFLPKGSLIDIINRII